MEYGIWANLGSQIFKFLDTLFDPNKQNYRRLIKKVRIANHAKRAFFERQRLRQIIPRTQKIIHKIDFWEKREGRMWRKFEEI